MKAFINMPTIQDIKTIDRLKDGYFKIIFKIKRLNKL